MDIHDNPPAPDNVVREDGDTVSDRVTMQSQHSQYVRPLENSQEHGAASTRNMYWRTYCATFEDLFQEDILKITNSSILTIPGIGIGPISALF